MHTLFTLAECKYQETRLVTLFVCTVLLETPQKISIQNTLT
jgi:hypothetical protein